MRTATLHAVRQQYGFSCGYCGISETDAGTTLTVDHYQPRSQGGSDDFSNLVYCCHACNEHKGSYWNQSAVERILHPTLDSLSEHYADKDDGVLISFTETGSFHIARLQLNRPALVAHRHRKRALLNEQRERAETLSVLNKLLRYVSEVKDRIGQLRSGGE